MLNKEVYARSLPNKYSYYQSWELVPVFLSDFLLFKKILTILSYDLFFLKAMADMEMLLLVLVILGIGALL